MQSPSLAAITAMAALALLNKELKGASTANAAFLATPSLMTHYYPKNNRFITSAAPPSLLLSSAVEEEQQTKTDAYDKLSKVPVRLENGIYDLETKEAHLELLASNPGKIVIMKFYAPWCRACKGLEPRFVKISKDTKYDKLPLVFAQMSVQHNKAYIKSMGILALPSVHIYAGTEGLVENFPCGPSKVPVLKKKIAQVVNSKVDPDTFELNVNMEIVTETEPCAEREVRGVATGEIQPTETEISIGDVVVSQQTLKHLRTNIPYFKDFDKAEFDSLMSKAKYATFEPNSIIMREGMVGRTFYAIDSGEVEISVRGPYEDPLTSGYLGTVINRFGKDDYFGERSLITGQVRAASIRAVEKTRCFTFDADDIPASSVLNGRIKPSEDRLAEVNDKYAVQFFNDTANFSNQLTEANTANQMRGSVNTPETITGVDVSENVPSDAVLGLLIRFKLLRHAARCFEYIQQTNPRWGDNGESYRRSLLVTKLTPAQRQEFTEVFRLIDISGDGKISIGELNAVLKTVDGGKERQTGDIAEMINKADPSVDGNTEIDYNEFMGVMAEAEFYYLFKDTFATLDKSGSGYIMAYKIESILGGLRDLISDDRKSIIDVEDKDMLVDYDTFSKMMIGTY